MKRNENKLSAGFSLIEVVVAITILGLVVVPIGNSLVLSHRLNARSEQLLQDQLAVSSVVETLMATGIDPDKIGADGKYTVDTSNTNINVYETSEDSHLYQVTVSSVSENVQVETYIRKVVSNSEATNEDPAQ